MSDFRPLQEHELARLSFEKLLAYLREARAAGDGEQARQALGFLVWDLRDRVSFWVSRKIPSPDVDDVTDEVIASAIKSSFDSDTEGQFVAWVRRIAQLRIADYHRRKERRPREQPLPEEHEEEEGFFGLAGEIPDPAALFVERSVVEQALGELNDHAHRLAVELAGPGAMGFQDLPAKAVAKAINDQFGDPADDPMTNVNVHKIVSRFRARVEQLARAADDNPGGG